jgi:type II secretory pathway component PulJ
MNNRRGTSLIELLIVMSACTVVLTLSAELIHRVMRVQSRSQAFANSQRSAQRLSTAFRNDVHSASRYETDPERLGENGLIRLNPTVGPAVEYRHKNGTIERVVLADTSAGQGASGEGEQAVTAREQFAFSTEIDVTAGRDDNSELVTLTIKPHVDDRRSGKAPLRSIAFEAPVYLEVQATLARNAQSLRIMQVERGSQ